MEATSVTCAETTEAGDTQLTIGEVASRYQLTLRALRFYEDRGLLTPTRVGATRLYGQAALRRLDLILKGKQLGFTLTEIREMVATRSGDADARNELELEPDQVVAQIELLRRQRREIEHAINELETSRQRMADDNRSVLTISLANGEIENRAA